MERLFGTDGVRGIPGEPPLTPQNVRNIAFLAAKLLLKREGRRVNGTAPMILMARDTRGSGAALGRALVAGFGAAGCRTVDLAVAPTPAVSYLVPRLGALCGVVVSASHNPAEFNGIKFFTADGFKMDPAAEDEIERELREMGLPGYPAASSRGNAAAVEDGSKRLEDYVDFLRSTFPPTLDLSGLKIVVDCAHGASAAIAPGLLKGLGAEVIALGDKPDGRNINLGCGALSTELMRRTVVRRGADCGVAFDGDADRAVFADEKGRLLDGDALIALAASRLHGAGLLKNDKVVLTVMSNYGLLRHLERQGLSVVSVPVGDRNVTQAIEREALSLGGESSGHIIFRRYAVTGDGMLTALQTLAALRESGRPMSAHREAYRATPQLLKNIAVERKIPLERLARFSAKVAKLEKDLKGEGRVFVRYSGTEPLLRIMIEGPSRSRISGMARELARAYFEETTHKERLK